MDIAKMVLAKIILIWVIVLINFPHINQFKYLYTLAYGVISDQGLC